VNYQADVRESTFFDVLQQQNPLTELLDEQQLQNLLPSLTLTTLIHWSIPHSYQVVSGK